jgi:L-fucose isomerase-like protein
MNLQLAYLSYNQDDKTLQQRSEEILKIFLNGIGFEWNSNAGQLLFIASGGSEKGAVEITKDFQYITLLCHREENSFAATMEIAAYLRDQGKKVCIIDVFKPGAIDEFKQVQKVHHALESLRGQKAALIGEVSDWLIISDVEEQTIKNKLGIELLRLPWDQIGRHQDRKTSSEFLKYFPNQKPEMLHETSKVYELLKDAIYKYNLSAISVECFSMVMRDQVTACLPLGVFNAQNTVAACEGDLVSMIGKMIIRAISNKIPWQANIAEIKEETILLAHCTAPLNAIKKFDITTHFETGVGTAIKGEFEKEKMAIFRLNNKLDKYMLIEGEITATPSHSFACRTQIELSTSPKQTQLLKEKSLGNHHLVFPADQAILLMKMMEVLGIDRVV